MPLVDVRDQSGRTSAPIIPHRVQTIRRQSDRTGRSSGKQSPLMLALDAIGPSRNRPAGGAGEARRDEARRQDTRRQRHGSFIWAPPAGRHLTVVKECGALWPARLTARDGLQPVCDRRRLLTLDPPRPLAVICGSRQDLDGRQLREQRSKFVRLEEHGRTNRSMPRECRGMQANGDACYR